ncbi:MAG: NlpC/P60 family protein, partial [Desulfonatronovibrio sp.]
SSILIFFFLLMQGCAIHPVDSGRSLPHPAPSTKLSLMKHSIQVGAFSYLDNAVRLMNNLKSTGLEAYYFKDTDNLYKVRFGNYPSYSEARQRAEKLQQRRIISNFFIVIPESYTAARSPEPGRHNLRRELVRTAHGFIGIPYRWGGESERSGFDCSGLTMVVYRQNGLNLPRVSRNQYQAGRKINLGSIQQGDLIFFATGGSRQVSHVGIYIGDGKFIHAPATGKNVTIEHINHPYFRTRFVGARTYI